VSGLFDRLVARIAGDAPLFAQPRVPGRFEPLPEEAGFVETTRGRATDAGAPTPGGVHAAGVARDVAPKPTVPLASAPSPIAPGEDTRPADTQDARSVAQPAPAGFAAFASTGSASRIRSSTAVQRRTVDASTGVNSHPIPQNATAPTATMLAGSGLFEDAESPSPDERSLAADRPAPAPPGRAASNAAPASVVTPAAAAQPDDGGSLPSTGSSTAVQRRATGGRTQTSGARSVNAPSTQPTGPYTTLSAAAAAAPVTPTNAPAPAPVALLQDGKDTELGQRAAFSSDVLPGSAARAYASPATERSAPRRDITAALETPPDGLPPDRAAGLGLSGPGADARGRPMTGISPIAEAIVDELPLAGAPGNGGAIHAGMSTRAAAPSAGRSPGASAIEAAGVRSISYPATSHIGPPAQRIAEPTVVEVHIGSVEIHAAPQQRPPRATPAGPGRSLDDYLAGRGVR
jgi:hypothetical protein